MNRVIFSLSAILIAISFGQKSHNHITHIWVLKGDSAYEINNYDLANCIPNPSTYCSYWTTTGFTFHTMSDSLFRAYLNNGYFTGHDFNRIYVE